MTVRETTANIQNDSEQVPPAAKERKVLDDNTVKIEDNVKGRVPSRTTNIVRSSKFRHIEGKFKHRSTFINKLPPLSSTVPGDSNLLQVKHVMTLGLNCYIDT